MIQIYKAEDGKIWKDKATGMLMTDTIYLGANASIDNYEQVDEVGE